jgi:hypothetical protein
MKQERTDAEDEEGWTTDIKSSNNKSVINWSMSKSVHLCAGLFIKHKMIYVCASSFSQRLRGNFQISLTCTYSGSNHRRLKDKAVYYFTTTTKKEWRRGGMEGIMKGKSLLITRDISFRSSAAHNVHVAWQEVSRILWTSVHLYMHGDMSLFREDMRYSQRRSLHCGLVVIWLSSTVLDSVRILKTQYVKHKLNEL